MSAELLFPLIGVAILAAVGWALYGPKLRSHRLNPSNGTDSGSGSINPGDGDSCGSSGDGGGCGGGD